MNEIRYVEGDLFAEIAKAPPGHKILIPHVVNNIGKWGAGFTGPLGEAFPWAMRDYVEHDFYAGQDSLRLGDILYSGASRDVAVAHMVAQDGVGTGQRRIRYDALASCMNAVAERMHPSRHIHCPKFGCGLAGGSWDFIEELIRDCWIRRGIEVTVYWLPERTKTKR